MPEKFKKLSARLKRLSENKRASIELGNGRGQEITAQSECEEIDQYQQKTFDRERAPTEVVDSVATILDRETESAIKEWLRRISADENLSSIELDDKTRSCHLPQLFKELVHRLRYPSPWAPKASLRSQPTNTG
jgi:hypothetical protein